MKLIPGLFWTTIRENKKETHSFEKLFAAYACSCIHSQLHLADFLVDLLHEVNDEVDQFVLVHLLCVEVRDQETNVVTLKEENNYAARSLKGMDVKSATMSYF